MEQRNGSPRHVSCSNNLIQALMTDKYQISMCYAYWRDHKHEEPAVFDLFFRKNPFKGEYTVFSGLEEVLGYLEKFSFSSDDIKYLKSVPDYQRIEPAFWVYLENLSTSSIKLYAMSEGSVCFPNSPLIRMEGPLSLVQLIETTLLNLVNYASLITTNAARYKMAANNGNMPTCKLLEFGLRRAQGPDGGFSASRYAYIGGFDATSNLLAGKVFGIPVAGTMSHAHIMAYFGTARYDRDNLAKEERYLLENLRTGKKENFVAQCLEVEEDFMNRNIQTLKGFTQGSHSNEKSELRAFIAFALAHPNTFLALVDTYDVIRSGLVNFAVVAISLVYFGYKPVGIRIDSGDLAYLSKYASEFFAAVATSYDVIDFGNLEIVASNDINEETINSLNDQTHAITSLGIGTHLVTCHGQPALGCVYKLVEINGNPCMKLSSMPEKITIPCKKSIYRLFGRDGNALLDLIIIDEEPIPVPGQRILCRHPFVAEKRCYATPARVEPLLNLCWDGQRVQLPPSLASSRSHCIKSLGYLTEDIKRSLNATPYKVSVSENLFNLLNQLKLNLTPIGELS